MVKVEFQRGRRKKWTKRSRGTYIFVFLCSRFVVFFLVCLFVCDVICYMSLNCEVDII